MIQRNGFGGIDFELKQTAQRHVTTALVVDDLRVVFVGVEIVGTGGVLQFGDGIGGPHVLFATRTPRIFAACIQHMGQYRVVAKSSFVHANGFFCHFKHAYAFDLAGGAGEVFGDGFAVDADGFKQLCAAVTHVGGHAHLGHDFGQAFAHCLDVVVNRFVGRQSTGQVLMQGAQCVHCQIRIDGFSAITRQHSKVMHLTRRTRFNHQTHCCTQARTHQVLMQG